MMKLIFGKPPENSNFDPQLEGWAPIKEPSPWIAQLIGIAVGALITVLLGVFWHLATPMRNFKIELGLLTLLSLVGIVVFHELIHAIFQPGYGITSNTYLGFWPSKLLFYAHYNSVLSKQRFMIVLIAPFILLSIIPLVFCVFFQYSSTLMCAISLFNAFLACVDVFGFILIYFTVPSGSVVQNKGWKTYYKIAEQFGSPDSGQAAAGDQQR